MITFNGKRYAKTDKEMMDSLFSGVPVVGFYKRVKDGIRLYTHQRELFAFVVIRGESTRVIVDASMQNGRPWYMHAASDATYKRIGFEPFTFASERSVINNIVEG